MVSGSSDWNFCISLRGFRVIYPPLPSADGPLFRPADPRSLPETISMRDRVGAPMRAIVDWRQAGWASLAGHGLLFAVLYFVGVSRMRFFDEFDLGKLQAYFPAGRLLARLIPVA